MADFIPGSETRVSGDVVGQVFHGGEEAEFVFGNGTQIFPNLPTPIYGMNQSRVVSDTNKRWFEMGFELDGLLTGNPSAGWTDAGNYFKIDYEWSSDLVTWHAGKFIAAPVPVVNLGGGRYQYWARAIHPVDAAVKSGAVFASSGYQSQPGNIGGEDTRNHPFTGLTVAGVAQALGGFPYTMPADAARMQADIRARGWAGATVEASSSTVWRIFIPAVNYTAYAQQTFVLWPLYLVPDMFGNVVNPVDRANFTGSLVDAAGTAIFTKGFGRLKISGGSRYDPWR